MYVKKEIDMREDAQISS